MFPNLLIFCLNIAFNVLHELSGRESGGGEREREERNGGRKESRDTEKKEVVINMLHV